MIHARIGIQAHWHGTNIVSNDVVFCSIKIHQGERYEHELKADQEMHNSSVSLSTEPSRI